MLLSDLELGGAVGGLGRWLAEAGAASGDLLPGADAALAILEFAAERQEWATVVQLARAVEQTLFLAKRWQAWHHLLGQGLAAAKAGAASAEAYFAHQLGSLELCLDHLDEATRLLRHAQALREQAGDTDGATLSRQNLEQIEPPDPPPPPRPARPSWRRWLSGLHPAAVALATVLSTLGLVAGSVEIARALGGGEHHPAPARTSPASTKPPRHTSSAGTSPSGPGQTDTGPAGSGSASPAGMGTSTGTSTSTGTGQVTVPSLLGETQTAAASALQGAGLTSSFRTTTVCDLAQNGTVIYQQPYGGFTGASPGAIVFIMMCNLPETPSVVGESQDLATSTLEAAGLSVSPTFTGDCDVSLDGTVLTQDPPAGAAVSPRDGPVTIDVCSLQVTS